MRILPLAAAVAALLVPAAPAYAGDPIMPLSDVQAGMHCTGYSVVRGTAISSFDVNVVDVADGFGLPVAPAILITVSGPAVDTTGIGPGFSGSPIYCPDAAGVMRNIGAISESVGAYGGKEALATPIQAILATPPDAPPKPAGPSATATRRVKAAARTPRLSRAAWQRIARQARPLTTPLTVSGLSGTVGRALEAAGAKTGHPVLATPAGPLGTFPPQTLQPGSAVGVGYSSGDIEYGAIGTVTYVDGDRVWAFGHPLEGVGGRALLLQDAYVYDVVNNPIGGGGLETYKLASLGHNLGTLGDDGLTGVAGRTGVFPHTVPVHVLARDVDAKHDANIDLRVADEAAMDLPSGSAWTSALAPLAVVQAATNVFDSSPARATGDMCARITVAELAKPMRFCNRYVSTTAEMSDDGSLGNAVTTSAASDLAQALGDIDAYTGRPPNVTQVSVLLKLRRNAQQAFIRHISLPHRVRAGHDTRVKLTLQQVRGDRFTRTYSLHIPSSAPAGRQTLELVGQDTDAGDDGLATIILDTGGDPTPGGDPGPRTLHALAKEVARIHRYDGVRMRLGHRVVKAFRDGAFRISGQAEATVRILRGGRSPHASSPLSIG
jgi:hypothetical protein